MNIDKVEELAKKVYGVKVTKNPLGNPMYEFTSTELAMFAELMLKASFDVVINDGRFHDAKGVIRAGKYTAMEHFGIEE